MAGGDATSNGGEKRKNQWKSDDRDANVRIC